MPNRGHIIIVNDNPVDADVLQELLETNGYRVDKEANGKKALPNISKAKPNLILLSFVRGTAQLRHCLGLPRMRRSAGL